MGDLLLELGVLLGEGTAARHGVDVPDLPLLRVGSCQQLGHPAAPDYSQSAPSSTGLPLTSWELCSACTVVGGEAGTTTVCINWHDATVCDWLTVHVAPLPLTMVVPGRIPGQPVT